MYDVVVVHVVEAVEQLQHYALDLSFAKMIRHVVQQRSQVLLAILHDEKDAVEALADDGVLVQFAYCATSWAAPARALRAELGECFEQVEAFLRLLL